MRRTYRSKKDTGGGVDHRDMVLSVDSKSSIFDAYYIQNIKQVKREMSCVSSSNQHTTTSHKVRKRKYVKRLKDPEPVRESLSKSAYLTPDKSIHVNKTPDLFDQLLNSSTNVCSPKTSAVSHNNVHNLVQSRMAKKTYCRKKLTKTKKFDYFSSDGTDSDKENSFSDESTSINTSNIKAHKLVIEKEKKLSPIHLDDSINTIAEIYPDLNILRKLTTKGSRNRSDNNILLNVTRSPLLQASPQCSTPFHEKYRGNSIYNFSPITNRMEESVKNIDENINNNSLFHNPPNDYNNILENNSIENVSNKESNSQSLKQNRSDNTRDIILQENEKADDNQAIALKYSFLNKTEQVLRSVSTSLSTTELEPFLGFPVNSSVQNSVSDLHKLENGEDLANNGDDLTIDGCISDNEIQSEQSVCKFIENVNSSTDSSMQSQNETNIHFDDSRNKTTSSGSEFEESESLYDTCDSENLSDTFEEVKPKVLTVTVERLNDSVFQKYYKRMIDSSLISENTSNIRNSVSNDNNDIISNINESDYESFKDSEVQDDISSNSSNDNVCNNNDRFHSENLELIDVQVISSSENDNSDSNDIEEEDKFLSFVTTRRRNDVTNDSFLLNLDNSCNSASSASLDKTILSYNREARERLEETEFIDNTLVNESADKIIRNDISETDQMIENDMELLTKDSKYPEPLTYKSISNEKISNINSRKSSRLFRESTYRLSQTHTDNAIIETDEKIDTDVELLTKGSEYPEPLTYKSFSNEEMSNMNSRKSSRLLRESTHRLSQTHSDNDITETDEKIETDMELLTKGSEYPEPLTYKSFSNEEMSNINSRKSSRLLRESTHRLSQTHSDNDITETDEKIETDMELLTKGSEYPEPLTHKSISNEEMSNINTRKSSRLFRESTYRLSQAHTDETSSGLRQGIVLKPGKKWERSLSIYRRMTTMGDSFNHSILDDESMKSKGRKYRQSVISTMEMQEYQGSIHNESVSSRRSTFVSKPWRSTIKIFKDPNATRISLSSSVLYDDLEGFLNGDCDDTIIELSKLSIGDSGHEVTVLDKFHDTSNRIVTARDYVLRRCNQTEVVLFDECYPDTVLKNCRKIGEGVYGEVYLWRAGDGRARVMKIVPIAGAVKVNGEDQKDYHEIISEIVIAMELSALRAPIPEIERQLDDGKEIAALDLQSVQNATDVFNEVLAIRCVYGTYPSRLLDLWELYDECKGSENDNPAALPPDQQYIVLELANAGQDLESYQFNNAEQACALFKQIALGLAVAEEAYQFEHRDLHWGNVLIAPTDQKYATFVLRGRLYRTARCGVAATLIDYSLSRAARDGRALYNDLAEDEALFDAVGDYQFEVYRLMRDKLGNDWKNYEPYTNILWLHYTVDKMITALRYTRTNTKIHKHYIAKLKEIKNRVLDYGSATQFILTDNEF